MLIITLIAVLGCLTRPTAPPPQVMFKPISTDAAAAPRFDDARERSWPELDVPTWEPVVDELLAFEVERASRTPPTQAETLTSALEGLEAELARASCAANAERPELEEAAMVVEQAELVVELGATDMAPDMLKLVTWVRANLEAPAASCVTPRLSKSQASDG